ncbi:hypothetical protein [Methyloprofundus sp.]|uniref:hypothetical protein n=1 Tax=Methyloprofundus sp. TaxID=2020875 RepID=UPI003D11B6AE
MQHEIPISQLIADMDAAIEAISSAETKDNFVPRFNQAKTVGCLKAQFRVHADIPEELKKGVFATAASYPAKLRFANATQQDDSKKDIRGLSIQLSSVQGSAVWGENGLQDFILNSYPALFVATPEDFLKFIQARQKDKKIGFFINPFDSHLKSLGIVIKARKKHLSPLDVRYWSTVPFRLGDQIVKYSVIPCSTYKTTQIVEPGENQLRSAIKAHLLQDSARFNFAVQVQTDPQKMPIEDASTIWDEAISPFQVVATITIEKQNFDTAEALSECEGCNFNPWQSLPEHEPVGRMNAVRQLVYVHAAKLRK